MSRPPEVPPELGTAAGSDPVEIVHPAPPAPPAPPDPAPGVLDLVARSARVGVDAAGLLATEVADATVRVARAVLPPAVAQRPLDAVGDEIDRRRREARRREMLSREEAAAALQGVVRQVVEMVLDQIDMEELVDRIPIDHVIDKVDIDAIAARIDVEAIIDRVDIGAIANDAIEQVDMGALVRDSTTGLAGETIDAVRVQVMGLDLFVSRVADRILRRPQGRDLALDGYDVLGPEIRVPKDLQ